MHKHLCGLIEKGMDILVFVCAISQHTNILLEYCHGSMLLIVKGFRNFGNHLNQYPIISVINY